MHYFYNFIKADTGVREFADLARIKPKLGLCIASPGFIAGQIARAYLSRYGVDVDRDIPAWGGEMFNVMAETTTQWMDGRANAQFRENTRFMAVGQASAVYDLSFLSLDRNIAEEVAAEFCLDVVEVPARSFRGQEHPLITVGNPGYSIVVREDMPDDLAYRLARALDVDSTTHGVSEDIFCAPPGSVPCDHRAVNGSCGTTPIYDCRSTLPLLHWYCFGRASRYANRPSRSPYSPRRKKKASAA
jgi:TRAP-type uncharacterized transport system substrate-binding protein